MNIPFDFCTLAAVVAELQPLLIGARVQKVRQPDGTDVVLEVYGKLCGARKLLLSADPKAARLHLTQRRRENPPQPLGFCQVARKYLEGAWLEAIELPFLDRICHFVFRSVDGERVTLIAELMGRNSNLILTSGAGIVRGVLRDSREGVRDLRHGVLYTTPPGINTTIDAPLGRFAEAEAAARGGSSALLSLLASSAFAPHSIVDSGGHSVGVWAFEPMTIPKNQRFPQASISVALDTFYTTLDERRALASEETEQERARRDAIARCDRAIAEQRRALVEASNADHYEESGNLLLASLGQLTKGQTAVTLTDFYNPDGGERTIALDPKRSPHENAEAYFDRAHKARDAGAYAERRLAELEAERVRLSHTGAELVVSRPESKSTQPTSGKKFDGHKVKTYTLGEWTLYIGENATANDYLLRSVAAPSDLWMHVRGDAGAHGVLKTNNHPERVPDSIVRQAAAMVAARSGKEKHAGLVPVDLTERRYVRKPRGSKPGLAYYTQAKTLDVEPALP